MDSRRRWRAALLLPAVIAIGLSTRRHDFWPSLPATYGGDTLWAVAAYLLLVVLRPAWSAWRVAAVAGALALAVELSQLSRAAPLEALRNTRLGPLLVGQGFLWSDLVCYGVGVGAMLAFDRAGLLSRPDPTAIPG